MVILLAERKGLYVDVDAIVAEKLSANPRIYNAENTNHVVVIQANLGL